jgi:membrane protein involved in colicin uptake
MNTFLEVSAALGGLVVFMSAVVVIAKAIFSQANATTENTKALERLTQSVDELKRDFAQHGERIARLETRKQSANTNRG